MLAGAQALVWQVPIQYNDIQLRGQDAVVLDSIIAQIPDSGKVHVRFDGHCTSHVGDRIIVAASIYPDWDTNDGNTDVQAYDEVNNTQSFNHTRVYDVGPGEQSFYAVAHNYVDIDGPGTATISGQLTVEFYPNDDLLLFGKGSNRGVFEIHSQATVIDSLAFEVPSAGRILVSYEGKLAIDFEDTIQLTTNLSQAWPNHEAIDKFEIGDGFYESPFTHHTYYDVAPGQHILYAMARKLGGKFDSKSHWFYATMSVLFIPDEVNDITSVTIPDSVQVLDQGIKRVVELEVTTAVKGSFLVHFNGRLASSFGDKLNFALEYDGDAAPITLDTQVLQSAIAVSPPSYFTNTGLIEVEPGNHTFRILASYDDESTGTGEAYVSGMLTARFVPEVELTSAVDVRADQTVSFFPNPTSGFIQAQHLSAPTVEMSTIRVADMTGQQVMQAEARTDNMTVDLTDLPNGLYLVTIRQGNSIETHTIHKITSDN